jgi:hypothetical protein
VFGSGQCVTLGFLLLKGVENGSEIDARGPRSISELSHSTEALRARIRSSGRDWREDQARRSEKLSANSQPPGPCVYAVSPEFKLKRVEAVARTWHANSRGLGCLKVSVRHQTASHADYAVVLWSDPPSSELFKEHATLLLDSHAPSKGPEGISVQRTDLVPPGDRRKVDSTLRFPGSCPSAETVFLW